MTHKKAKETTLRLLGNPFTEKSCYMLDALDEAYGLYYNAVAKSVDCRKCVNNIEIFKEPASDDPRWCVKFAVDGQQKSYVFDGEDMARDFMLTIQCMAKSSFPEKVTEGGPLVLGQFGRDKKWLFDSSRTDGEFELSSITLEYRSFWTLKASWHTKDSWTYGCDRSRSWFEVVGLSTGTFDNGVDIIRNLIRPLMDNVKFQELSGFEQNWVRRVQQTLKAFWKGDKDAMLGMPAYGPQEFGDAPGDGENTDIPHSKRLGFNLNRSFYKPDGEIDIEACKDYERNPTVEKAESAVWRGVVSLRQDLKGRFPAGMKGDSIIFVDRDFNTVLDQCDAVPAYSTVDSKGRPLQKADPVKDLDKQLAVLRKKMINLIKDENNDIESLTDVLISPSCFDDKDEKSKERNIIIGQLYNTLMVNHRNAKIEPIRPPASEEEKKDASKVLSKCIGGVVDDLRKFKEQNS